jgi:hypothetical protein
MPKIERWENLPEAVRQHLVDRMRDRQIKIADLNQLRVWIETQPDVPQGDWFKDFGSFKICGHGSYPKAFLLRGQAARAKSFETACARGLFPGSLSLVVR